MTHVAYRDDGFWTLLWQICWSILKRGRRGSFPPRGFVGAGSTSSVATDLHSSKLKSIHLRRRACTHDAHLWRLTLGWETYPPPSRQLKYGRFSHPTGRRLAAAGVGASRRRTRTTLTSQRSLFD